MSEKLQGGLLAGSVDFSIPVIMRSTSDNTEVDGKAYTDVTASYLRQGGSATPIEAAELVAVDSAHSDGGFIEIDGTNMPGLYRFDVPDAAIATGADWVVISIQISGCYVFFQLFHLTANLADVVLKRDWSAITGEADRSLLNAVRFLRNKWSISGTTLTITKEDDETEAWTAEVTGDAAANPIVSSDPA